MIACKRVYGKCSQQTLLVNTRLLAREADLQLQVQLPLASILDGALLLPNLNFAMPTVAGSFVDPE